MPFMYNGIGTRYVGKKNIQTRPGVCKFCNRQVNLQSYDTRLCFVVILVPVIPLKKKRILDYCPSCTRHYVMDLEKWETAKQLNVSGALQEYRQNPTVDNGLQAHGQLIAFHQHEEAAELRKTLCCQFPDNAKIQIHCGIVLWELGKCAEAEDYFYKALELRPDSTDAKIGVAKCLMRKGKLDEARLVQNFLEEPGAAQLYSLEPVEILGMNYQRAGKHAEALELFQVLLNGLPTLNQHAGFRKTVQTSEKALGRPTSILPKKVFNWQDVFKPQRARGAAGRLETSLRTLLVGAAVVGLLLFVAAVVNEWKRQHRSVYLVNGFKTPALISIDGKPPVTVTQSAPFPLTLAENKKHHVHITGPLEQDFDFPVVTDYFDRWSGSPVWLINVGGASMLAEIHATYRINPIPVTYAFHFGKSYERLPQIDFPFKPLPKTVELHNGHEESRFGLEFCTQPVIGVIRYLIEEKRTNEALELAEWALGREPERNDLFETYTDLVALKNEPTRALAFLRKGLSRRPVQIQWHRVYQHLAQQYGTGQEELVNEYSKQLEADPQNSALLYLRGRISPTHEETQSYFERAVAADPNNPFPRYAIGYDFYAKAKWDDAMPAMRRAAELAPDQSQFTSTYIDLLFASGNAHRVEEIAAAQLKRSTVKPVDTVKTPSPVPDLIEALLVQGREAEAQRIENEYEDALTKASQNSSSASLHRMFLYKAGHMEELEKECLHDKSLEGRLMLSLALTQEGKLMEAERAMPVERLNNPIQSLARGAAWLLAGDTTHADLCLQKSCEWMKKQHEDYQKLSDILLNNTHPSAADLTDLVIEPELKASAAAWLAMRNPDKRSDYTSVARQFNFRLSSPHHLVAKVIAQAQH